MPLQSRSDLRQLLLAEVGHEYARQIWSVLERFGYVKTALDPEEPTGLDEFRSEARFLRESFKAGVPRSSRGRSRPSPPLVPKHEIRRAQVVSKYWELLASRNSVVSRFRASFLGGRRLTRKQANDLLDSDAPRFYSLCELAAHGIPLVGHSSRIVHYDSDGKECPDLTDNVVLQVKWNGGAASIPCANHDLDKAKEGSVRLAILRNRRSIRPDGSWYVMPNRDPVLAGSVFDELRKASAELARWIPWGEAAAAWFVLSGAAPKAQPLRFVPGPAVIGGFSQGFSLPLGPSELRIEVMPWLSPQTLLHAYRQWQRDYYGHQVGHFSERNLALFEFVIAKTMRRRGRTLPWSKLMADWNQDHTDWAYGNPWRFERDFVRTRQGLIRSGSARHQARPR